ncbi:MAG: 30S ribosomal protein S9 [Chitinivibrionales bacterium]|nr:30S ribosomal protein S9 [Chitinivibrionales bacterium]MBD3358665.1 30S ribosomal protein S9 [Chitinivibrionales bacterium]
MESNVFSGTGKRKNAIASVMLKPGKGKRLVNGKKFEDYLKSSTLIMDVEKPMELLQVTEAYDLVARVRGGGLSGQSGALRLGVSRALAQISEDYRHQLRKNGLLTRDSRMVERKKYGLAGARKRFQFSKR